MALGFLTGCLAAAVWDMSWPALLVTGITSALVTPVALLVCVTASEGRAVRKMNRRLEREDRINAIWRDGA